jgi:hypothetical protein
MNLTLKLATFSCAALALSGAAGCKISQCTETTADGGTVNKDNCVTLEPTIEYDDARHRAGSQAWTSGRSISISNENGDVTVAVGGEGEEKVIFDGIAFTRDAQNDQGEQNAKNTLSAMANPAFAPGDFVFLVAPGGGVNGYKLTVWVPKDFDGILSVETKNGTTTLHGTEGAASTTVISHDIVATDLRRGINLHSKVGNIDFGGTLNGPSNIVQADLGDIVARVDTASNVGITATAKSGMLTFPAGWNTVVNPDKMAGSATLGDGSGMLSVTTYNGNVAFFAQ